MNLEPRDARDHALALALRASGDPLPPADLAARARHRAQAAAAGIEERLARGRRIVRAIETGVAVMAIVALAGVLLSGLDVGGSGGNSGNSALFSTSDSDPWLEPLCLAMAACIAAILYAVIARAEPLAAPEPRHRSA